MEKDDEDYQPEPLIIDDSFLDIKEGSITFSVHKVEKMYLDDLRSEKNAFAEAIKKLHDQLEFEHRCKYPSSEGKSTNTASIEAKKMLYEKSEFPYGSKKIDQVAAIYGSPMKIKKTFSPTKKFQGLGTMQDNSLKHEKHNGISYVGSDFSSSVSAVHSAFVNHQHLALSPSDFVILIGQGLANHINQNPEKLRHNFVDHEGQKSLRIFNSKVQLNGRSDWSPIFEQFCEEIKQNVKKDIYSVVIDDLSTATPITKVVSEMNLMDCMKNYFRYECTVGCGFPKITLKGKPDDWKKFRSKIAVLEEMNKGDSLELDWWLTHMVPVVEKICEAGIDRKVDRGFWGNLCQSVESYGEVTTGWINAFCPYLYSKSEGVKRNFVLEDDMNEDFTFPTGVHPYDYCEGISKVPFMFEDRSLVKHSMHCYSGFLGGKYDSKNDWIEPAYFWSVYEDPKK